MKVFYSGNFWGGHKYEHAGRAIPINKEFMWGGVKWLIPSVYSCSKGLVIDFCVEVKREKFEDSLNKLMNKRNSSNKIANIKISELSDDEIEQLERENPFFINIEVEAKINGRESSESRMCSVCWHPFDVERDQIEDVQEELMDYYSCDRNQGWKFIRVCLPWSTSRKPKLKDISITLKEHPVAYSGEHFITEDSCNRQELTLIHPVTKSVHKLILYSCESKSLPESSARFSPHGQLPNMYKALTYSISPDLAPSEFGIQDCASSDKPRRHEQGSNTNASDGIASCGVIGIIGSADGPTAIMISGDNEKGHNKRIACSSLHFEPALFVEWKTIFYVKENEDLSVDIKI